MDRYRLIALHAIPGHFASPSYDLLLINDIGRSTEFAFNDIQDLGRFQQALIGYRLHHNASVARWRINGSSEFGDTGMGTIQLWQFKPLTALSGSSMVSVTGTGSSCGNSSLPLSMTTSRRESRNLPPVLPALSFQEEEPVENSRPNGLHIVDSRQKIESF